MKQKKNNSLFWFSEQNNPVHTDDSIGVAPAVRLSADWGLAGGVAPRWRAQQADYY